jgi:hypothetical protein
VRGIDLSPAMIDLARRARPDLRFDLGSLLELVGRSGKGLTVTAPRVNDKRVDPETNERQRFSSRILPARSRKPPKVAEVFTVSILGLRRPVSRR